MEVISPVTVAGPRRIFTGFPFQPQTGPPSGNSRLLMLPLDGAVTPWTSPRRPSPILHPPTQAVNRPRQSSQGLFIFAWMYRGRPFESVRPEVLERLLCLSRPGVVKPKGPLPLTLVGGQTDKTRPSTSDFFRPALTGQRSENGFGKVGVAATGVRQAGIRDTLPSGFPASSSPRTRR
jgi:hypothetical protein